MKKVIVISSTPRRGGNSEVLAEEFARGAGDAGHAVEVIDLRTLVPMDKENNPELRSEKFTVQQGMLELSNSNVIKEMINTIQTSRNYESLTKVVSTNNELNTLTP